MQGRGWKQSWAEEDVNCGVGVLGASTAHQRPPGVKMTGLWSISLRSQVEAALPKTGPLGGSSLLLRQDLSWRVPRKGSKPCPPEGGSQLHHTLLGFFVNLTTPWGILCIYLFMWLLASEGGEGLDHLTPLSRMERGWNRIAAQSILWNKRVLPEHLHLQSPRWSSQQPLQVGIIIQISCMRK